VDEHVRYGRLLCENRLSFGIYMIFENYVDNYITLTSLYFVEILSYS
jgi:hypothetical protein